MYELTTHKPKVSKNRIKLLRINKWEHAEEVYQYFYNLGIDVIWFDKSTATPHIRILNCDYWAASGRFYDHIYRKWGTHFENLKIHIHLQIDALKMHEQMDDEVKEICRV